MPRLYHLFPILLLALAAPAKAEEPLPVGQRQAVFAGGCFWCMEPPFDALPGVVSTTSGYAGGTVANPTYEQVSAGGTGHLEVLRVIYDPATISYDRLLQTYWRNIDPVTAGGQFCDQGPQYRSAIFHGSAEEEKQARAAKAALEAAGTLPGPVVTEILPLTAFYAAEDYHQDYYRKNPLKYKFYRTTCGRDKRLRQLWGKKG